MSQDLAALLVDEGAVSKADMDRAVARQAQEGGALDTALLELGLIGEGHLLSFMAHAAGVAAAPLEAFKEIDPRARRVFPAKVAERHRLAPFGLDGRELSVVACQPVDGAAIDEIGFMLSLTLVPYVAVEWRVHDLIHRLYGGPLPARLAKLADAALVAPPAAPRAEAAISAPAAPQGPAQVRSGPPAARPASPIEDAFFAAGEAGTFTLTPAPQPVEPPPPPPGPVEAAEPPPVERAAPPPPPGDEASFADIEPERPAVSGFSSDGSEPAEPLLAALEQAVDAYDALWADVARPASPSGEGAPSPVEPPGSAVAEPTEPVAPSVTEPAPEPEAGPQAEAEPEEPEEPPPDLDRSAPPRWSIDDARTALAAVSHRDAVVLTVLRYARDFFEFSALFAVTRDAVVGHDALGPQEDERSRARGTAIYASDSGIIRTVLETRAPYLGPVSRDAVGTANILDGLWRGNPRTVLLYPILVSDRPVAVLYADNGEAPVSARRLGDLLLFLSTVGGSFERIIRARKKRGKRAGPKAAPPLPMERPAPDPAPEWMAPPPSVSPDEAVGDGAGAAHGAQAGVEPPPSPAAEPSPASAPEAQPAPVTSTPPAVAAPARPQSPPARSPASIVEETMGALLAGGGAPDRPGAVVDLLLDPNAEVASAARDALVSHRADPAVQPIPERLRRALLSGVGDRPVLAALALGALRDVESIPILIQALEGGSAAAAAEALAAITLHRLGTSPQKWLKWWKENRGRTRAEWLFAALNSGEAELRAAASSELRAAGEPPVRYSPDLPTAEREAAARAWWVWWARQGLRV